MRRSTVAEFKTFAEIRAAQQTKAEAVAERSASSLRTREADLAGSRRQCETLETQWMQSVARAVMEPGITQLWSAALVNQERAVDEAGRKVALATDEVARSAVALHSATMQRDAAGAMAHKAGKTRDRRRNDIADQDALDRHAQRRRTS